MDTRINNGMCRCCASEGTFKDLTSTYHWMGEAEVYADMLKECFDIILSKEEDCDDNGICEVCITQLRNASNFKKQVLHTEEQFKQRLQDKLFKTNIVKVELANTEEAIDSDNDNASEGYSGADFEVPIKVESLEEVKPKKRAAKASTTTTRAKKAKIDAGETSTKRIQRSATKESPLKILAGLKRVLVVKREPDAKSTNYPTWKQLKNNQNITIRKMNIPEIFKHRHNIREIMKNSNATPIRKCNDIGYCCCFCKEAFAVPADLKMHTIQMHDDKSKEKFIKYNGMYSFLVKLDITSLKCKICDEIFESLDRFNVHLEEHGIRLYSDVKSRILPFKFDDNILRCSICLNVYRNMKVLQEHMYSHFRNYECDICGAGFVNQQMITKHKVGHKLGVFKCDYCLKTFDTQQKKKKHQRSVHEQFLYKCGYCNEKFKDHHKKQSHLTEVHGASSVKSSSKSVECQACERVFSKQSLLTRHIKKDHLLERCHKCSECGKQFYSSYALKEHMVKHTGTRDFQCEVCLKTFVRKKSLRVHVRIHAEDRRFKCEYCGKAFVQKCSLTGHMRSKHSDVVQQGI